VIKDLQVEIRDWAYQIKSDHILEFVSKLYPDKQWTKSIPFVSSDKKTTAGVVQNIRKEKTLQVNKTESGKDESSQTKKEALPPIFVEQIIQALKSPSQANNAAIPLLENGLKAYSKDEVLEFLVSNERLEALLGSVVIFKTKPEAMKKVLWFYNCEETDSRRTSEGEELNQ
jgi:hypothetical protein